MQEGPYLNIPQFDFIPYLEKAVIYAFQNYTDVVPWLAKALAFLISISIPLSVIFVLGIVVAVERLKRIRTKEEEIYDTKVVPAYDDAAPKADLELARRWEMVMKHIDSDNSNDWKQAIIEADIMLDSMLTTIGYQGESVGEKLKRVEKGDFETLQLAWEAHLVRNNIAHEGSAFTLDKREARRVVMLYREVFKEFYYI